MKNNLLFSIILHIALLLPIPTLGAEPTKNWYEKIYSYMPQTPNLYEFAKDYALYLVLAALSLGYVTYTQYQKEKKSPQPTLQEQEFGFTAIDKSNLYASNNMYNIAIFLSNAEFDNWNTLTPLEFNNMRIMMGNQPIQPKALKSTKKLELFTKYIYPILQMLQLPQNFIINFWSEFIQKVTQNAPDLPMNSTDLFYLKKLKQYIYQCEACTHKAALDESLQMVIDFMTAPIEEENV